MRYLGIIATIAVCLAVAGPAQAMTVYLYADTAPNDSSLTAWRATAFEDAADGTFVDMRSGAFPGTNIFKPEEQIVYSTMDLGRRMMWVYWIPGETTTSLAGKFQANQAMDWDGVEYAWGADPDMDNGWYTPASWLNYTNSANVSGVVGMFGNAWWAVDDSAPPLSTNSNPYDETDAADIAAVVADCYQYQTYTTGLVRYRDDVGGSWTTEELKLDMVPEPLTMAGLGLGLFGLVRYVRRRR